MEKKRKFKNLQIASEKEARSLVGFDPAEMFVAELRAMYSHAAVFFHDELGGSVVGVVWNPAVI